MWTRPVAFLHVKCSQKKSGLEAPKQRWITSLIFIVWFNFAVIGILRNPNNQRIINKSLKKKYFFTAEKIIPVYRPIITFLNIWKGTLSRPESYWGNCLQSSKDIIIVRRLKAWIKLMLYSINICYISKMFFCWHAMSSLILQIQWMISHHVKDYPLLQVGNIIIFFRNLRHVIKERKFDVRIA